MAEQDKPQQPNKPRKARGSYIEETELMKALEADPAAAMQALADEADSDWEENSPPKYRNLMDAEDG